MAVPMATAASPRRAGRIGLLPVTAAVVALGLAGCTSPSPSGQSAGTVSPSAASTSAATKIPTVRVTSSGSTVSFQSPVRINVTNGLFSTVRVSAERGGQQLDGTVSGDGMSWQSTRPPRPAVSYRVVATVKDGTGQEVTKAVTFQVAPVPASQKVSFTVTPDDGTRVGIGQPIVVRFLTSVTQRAAMERAMLVDARTPSGQSVAGSWTWLNGKEAHWRPQKFWTPGTTVHLDMQIAGVKASKGRYGRKDYSQTFTIGASHVTRVDLSTHRVRVYRDGRLVDTWPTGGGRPGLETYSGTYIVLGKAQVIEMDSCSARITCDKKDPDYYSEKEYWATRVTASGTFLHAASWDGLLGRANTSHGCIHLSDADAKDFYNHTVIGDVVIVSNTGRGPQQRIATQDPGLYDWNVSWSTWLAGSALH